MKTKLQYAKTAMFALACFSCVGVFGQTRITDEKGLKAIGENPDGDYVLANNITLSEAWVPIGTNDVPFTGTIDGQGFTVFGLKINLPEQNSVGFIGVAKGSEDISSSEITVKNLRLVGVEVFGRQDAGAVIGTSIGAKVSQCYTSGFVYGWDHVGAIIGGTKKLAEGVMTKVSNSYSTAGVASSNWQAGGIIGASINAAIDHCYFGGVAVCSQGRSGGIVALNDGGELTISNSVVLSSYIKGDAGTNGGANALLGGANEAEGISTSISKSYSWSGTKLYEAGVEKARTDDSETSFDGKYMELDVLKSISFWLEKAEFDRSIWTINENAYPSLSGVELPLANYLYYPSFPERCLPGRTFNAEAIVSSGRTVTYTSSDPEVATISDQGLVTFIKDGNTTLTFADQGDDYVQGIEKKYELTVKGVAYTIMDEEDLKCIKYDLAGDFKLGADIHLTKDWELMEAFTGTLDGQGYAIHNLRYVNESQGRVGLFGEATGATIKRVGIVGAYINGNEDVGAIVGLANGCTISECFVDQSSYIAGRDHVGSIVGKIEKSEIEVDGVKEVTGTTVSDCYSMAVVYSIEFQAGGVAGVINYGTLERSYFSGTVRADKGRAGGIFSLVDADGVILVQNNVCLASGIYCPEATYYIGQKGDRKEATLANNYVDYFASYKGADLASSEILDGSEVYDNAGNQGERLEGDEVLEIELYRDVLKWDFDHTWTFVDGGENNSYPILKCQQSKVITPVIYGVPNPAFLIQKSDGKDSESINLEKIKSTCGQKLTFEVTNGKEYIFIDGTFLDLKDGIEIDGEALGTVSITSVTPVTGLKPFAKTAFDVKLMGQSYVYDITTVDDLLAVNNRLYANFRLMNNIDMKGVTFNGFGSLESPFIGTFDGNGHSILNPVVITNDDNTKGFFNATKGATIKNLGISNFSFSGSKASGSKSTNLGGFAGSAKDTKFDQCYLTGKVVGRDHVGGFVGGDCDKVTITNSFVNVEVLAYSQAGGFFGVAAGNVTMRNCYFTGSVELDQANNNGWVGGFVGLVDVDNCTVTIENCVSVGSLKGSTAAGAFIGANGNEADKPKGIINFTGNVLNYDAPRELMGGEPSTSDWENIGAPTREGGTIGDVHQDYDSEEFLTKAPYETAGFDFSEMWTIDSEKNEGYPTLAKVLFVKGDGTGIVQEVANKENVYLISVSDNVISISGMKDAAKIALYNLSGQVISQTNVAGGESAELAVAGKGFYIVRIAENETLTSVKVIIQ